MICGTKFFFGLLSLLLILFPMQGLATDTDYRLHVHVEYQQKFDTWRVRYELPIATDHIAFSRKSNFDRSKLYIIDTSKFKWDKAGDVLLIRSLDGSNFKTLDLTFSSSYEFIQKDYTHNLKYSDGSVLLYTNHLALGANIIEDKSVSPIGASFSGTKFHFYSEQQSIIFLGKIYEEKAVLDLVGDGTYIYFGNIKPIESDNLIAIVDPMLPEWAWDKTQEYFPKLFEYYAQQTGQQLNFKPVVFFNYDDLDGEYSNYSGGTLDGLVQLTINGSRWKTENEVQFNKLFHFLAHEAAHFWNGQMFSFEDMSHSWMHEGGADAFANFAMREFEFIDTSEMVHRFEEAVNHCVLNKGEESLAQSSKLQKYRNYYTCGATMAFASDLAIKAQEPSGSFFDIWRIMFDANLKDNTYSQQDYFIALSKLAKSDVLSKSLEEFSNNPNIDNLSVISSWFMGTKLSATPSGDFPTIVERHWGKKIITLLMQMHCEGFSLRSNNDYIETYPLERCSEFESGIEIQYVDGLDVFKEGIAAYTSFRKTCEIGGAVKLQNTDRADVAKVACLIEVPKIEPYLKFEVID